MGVVNGGLMEVCNAGNNNLIIVFYIKMDAPELPLEMLVMIAYESPEAFKAMLALRPVAEFARSHRKSVLDKFTIITVSRLCVITYTLNGKLHNEYGPAIIEPFYEEWLKVRIFRNTLRDVESINGRKEWYQGDKRHRDGDLPAVESCNGFKAWYRRGKLHRDNGPAIIYDYVGEEWYQGGKRHRDGDLPAAKHPNGKEEWYRRGKRHRDGDLPAVICPEIGKEWYQGGKLHRDGGLPAIERPNGFRAWYHRGILIREEI